MTDEALQLLREIRDNTRRMLDIIESRPARALSPTDDELLRALRPAIGGVLGSVVFEASDIIECAATPEGVALRVVLGPLQAWSPKRLGMLLGRGADAVVDGYRIERRGDGRNGALWRVVQVGP